MRTAEHQRLEEARWMPVNHLLIESLRKFHAYYGDDFRVECPTGSGTLLSGAAGTAPPARPGQPAQPPSPRVKRASPVKRKHP